MYRFSSPLQLGMQLPKSAFAVRAVEGLLPAGALHDIVGLRSPIILVRKFLSAAQCAALAQNFDRLIAEAPHRSDGVSAVEIGGTLFAKMVEQYLDASDAAAPKLSELYAGAVCVPELLRTAMQATLPQGAVIKQIEHLGRLGSAMRAVAWRDVGAYALKLHTDEEQFLTTALAELVACASPIAANVYTRAAGSALRVYNCIFSRSAKRRMGLIDTLGYPVDPDCMEGREYVDIELQDGDLVLMLGSMVHGVPWRPGIDKRQLLNTFFAFRADDPTEVYMGT
jgi:hypothetical protein